MIRRANLFYDISGIGDENALKSAPPMKFFSKRRSKVDDLFKDNCLDHLKIESSVNFVPDSEFLTEWKENLSTKAILNLLDYLIPKLKTLAEKKGRLDNEFVVLEMIQSSTVVGILPPPHSIVVRRYMSTRFTTVWFATYIWGLVFLKNEKPTVFEPKAIKLFTCGYSDPSRNKK